MKEAVFMLVLFVVILIAAAVGDFVVAYRRESKYIKMEISRACTHNEKVHWQHELQRLKKRYFPILHLFKRKKK